MDRHKGNINSKIYSWKDKYEMEIKFIDFLCDFMSGEKLGAEQKKQEEKQKMRIQIVCSVLVNLSKIMWKACVDDDGVTFTMEPLRCCISSCVCSW